MSDTEEIEVRRKKIRGITFFIDDDNNLYDLETEEKIGVWDEDEDDIIYDDEDEEDEEEEDEEEEDEDTIMSRKAVVEKPYPTELQFTEKEQKYYDKNKTAVDAGARDLINIYWKPSSGQSIIYRDKLKEATDRKRALQMDWDKGIGRPYAYNEDFILEKMKKIKEIIAKETDEAKIVNQKKVIAGLIPKLQQARATDKVEVVSQKREQEDMGREEQYTKNIERERERQAERERRRLQDIEDAKLLLTPAEVKEKLNATPRPSWITIRNRPFTAVNYPDGNPYGYRDLDKLKDMKYFLPDKIYKIWGDYREFLDPDTLEPLGRIESKKIGLGEEFVFTELGKQRLKEYKPEAVVLREQEEERKRIEREEKYRKERDDRIQRYKDEAKAKADKEEADRQQYLIDRENPALYTKKLWRKANPLMGIREDQYTYTKIPTTEEVKQKAIQDIEKKKKDIQSLYENSKIYSILPDSKISERQKDISKLDMLIKDYEEKYGEPYGKGNAKDFEKKLEKDDIEELQKAYKSLKTLRVFNSQGVEQTDLRAKTKEKLDKSIRDYKEKYRSKKEGTGIINNPTLYQQVKDAADIIYDKPSAYKSGFIVKKYKELGGTYSGKKENKGIGRWFQEEWKDVGNKEYPVYRPTKRITKDTPLTPNEIKPANLKKQIALKQEIKGDANLPPFEKKGGKVVSLGQEADKISKYDEIYKYSNPKKVQELAKKYLGDGATIFRSFKKDKKYMVYNPNTQKWVHFGQLGYEDFTKHMDEKRRKNYLTRTANMRGNWKNDKYSPNNLSRNLLW